MCVGTDSRSASSAEDVTRVVLRRHLETFLERAAEAGGLPAFVVDELRDAVTCGALTRGFARARCDTCGRDRLVGFSCGGRGFCGRCGGRRMNDTAAYLADQVLVGVPVRQWVLTVPWWLRARLQYDNALTSVVLGVFIRTVHGWLRRRCGGRGRAGSVTVVQRFGAALRAHTHLHSLIPHGTYVEGPDGGVTFLAAPVPTPGEVRDIAARVAARVVRRLRALGVCDHDGGWVGDEPALGACVVASANQQQLLGPAPGSPTLRERDPLHISGAPGASPLTARAHGFNLHAGVAIRPTDPNGLERLCRYVARPPIASRRLRLLEGDRVAIDLRRPWRDGTTTVVLDPLDFIARLAALVPPPRTNAIRYHGALAPNARLRGRIVRPAPPRLASPPCVATRALPAAPLYAGVSSGRS